MLTVIVPNCLPERHIGSVLPRNLNPAAYSVQRLFSKCVEIVKLLDYTDCAVRISNVEQACFLIGFSRRKYFFAADGV